MSTTAHTNRRWLRSAIAAASQEQVVLPWVTKRRTRQLQAKSTPVIRILTSAPSQHSTSAAQ
jgi:hypothetical protein